MAIGNWPSGNKKINSFVPGTDSGRSVPVPQSEFMKIILGSSRARVETDKPRTTVPGSPFVFVWASLQASAATPRCNLFLVPGSRIALIFTSRKNIKTENWRRADLLSTWRYGMFMPAREISVQSTPVVEAIEGSESELDVLLADRVAEDDGAFDNPARHAPHEARVLEPLRVPQPRKLWLRRSALDHPCSTRCMCVCVCV